MHSRKLINWITKTKNRGLAKLAGRPKLPGSNGKCFPTFLNEPPNTFPHKIRAQDRGVNEKTSPENCADAVRFEISFVNQNIIKTFQTAFTRQI